MNSLKKSEEPTSDLSRLSVEKKLARLGVKVDWDKLSGTAYEDNPKLLLEEYLLVKNAIDDIAGNAMIFSDDFLGSVDSGDAGLLTDEEMRGLGML
jgi:hypothetical protein